MILLQDDIYYKNLFNQKTDFLTSWRWVFCYRIKFKNWNNLMKLFATENSFFGTDREYHSTERRMQNTNFKPGAKIIWNRTPRCWMAIWALFHERKLKFKLGRGCGTAREEVDSAANGPWFESSHKHILLYWKDENKETETREGREPWTSGYGRGLVLWRLWFKAQLHIPTGRTFLYICFKSLMSIWKHKNKRKRDRGWSLKV